MWGTHGLVDLVVSYLVLLVMQPRSERSVACAASSVPVRASLRRALLQARSSLHCRRREKGLHVFCAVIVHAFSGKSFRAQGKAKETRVLSIGCGPAPHSLSSEL